MAAQQGRPGSGTELGGIIEQLDITPLQKELLRQRWLDQVAYMGRKAREARRRYTRVRAPMILGGVLVPGLISILLATGDADTVDWLGVPTSFVRLAAFFVSLAVAGLAAAEESFRFAEQWRHYRRTAERLKTLGWQYVMLSGAFKRYRSHADAFVPFTEHVENAINEDVEGYLGSIAGDTPERTKTEIVT